MANGRCADGTTDLGTYACFPRVYTAARARTSFRVVHGTRFVSVNGTTTLRFTPTQGAPMNRFRKLPLFASALVCSGAGVAVGADNPLPASDSATAATNAFAFHLYRQVAAEDDGANLFFSPYSLEVALGIACHGARGETAEEMGTVLGLPAALRSNDSESPWNTHAFLESLAAVSDAITARADSFEFRSANALWAEQTYPLSRSFLESIRRTDGTGALFSVDFRHDFESVRKEINRWTDEQTNQRIRDLLAPGTLDESTRLVISNAIYFKGEWVEPFDEKRTRPGDFTLTSGEVVQTELMAAWNREHARYGAFNRDGSYFETPDSVQSGSSDGFYPDRHGFHAVELPYEGDRLSMILLVPMDPGGLSEIESLLSADALAEWVEHLEKRSVHVTLPKFSLEAGYSMKSTLASMGMRRAFSDPATGNGADFSGMTDSQGPANLYISQVIHKAFLEVSEEGTEAAAATAVIDVLSAVPSDRLPFVPTVRADHPFVFLIRDLASGTILFLGRFTSPAL